MTDIERYRVYLVCSCQKDVAYGYGPTEPEARVTAEHAFREHHGTRAVYTQVIIEHASADGSHYEVERLALHVELASGLGAEIRARSVTTGALALGRPVLPGTAIVVKNPKAEAKRWVYVFEASTDEEIRGLLQLLHDVRVHPPRGQGGMSTQHAARKKLVDLKPVIKHLWPELWEERNV